MNEVTVLVRTILSLPRDEEGLFVQPDELTAEFAIVLEKNRDRMATKWDYADEWTGNARTVDKKKNYNCGGCNQADGDVCLALYDDSDADAEDEPPLVVDLDYGSCGKYEIICAGDPELRANRLPASVANYGIRKDGSPGHVFGCQECPFAKETKWPDSRNRRFWCGKGASTVQDGACCTINGAPTVDTGSGQERSVTLRRSASAAMMRKVVPAQIKTLGEDEVEVRMSTSIRARDGHILLAPGAQLENYRRNPVFLWNHDVDLPPIGRSEDIRIEEADLVSRVRFPPMGISARADEIRGLAKTGFLNAVSVGFNPLDGEVIDAAKPRAGSRFTSWELLECSFCCVPVDPEALVTQRAQVDIPNTVIESAREALDSEEKARMSDQGQGSTNRAIVVKHRRALERAPKLPIFRRGLYDVAALASILGQVGYATDSAEWEAEIEEDNSQVPAMLGEALRKLGEALIAMTSEEVGELLAMHAEDDEGSDEESGERAFVLAGKTPRARAWRRAIVMTRAGKAISTSNAEKLGQAQSHQERALKHHGALGEHHAAVTAQMDGIADAHKRAVKAHGDLGEALDAVNNEPAKATEHVARAIKSHGAIASHHRDMTEAYEGAVDRHQDIGDAHSSLGRCIRAAQRSVRAVVDGSTPTEDEDNDDDSAEVQTSAGTEQSDGSISGRSYDQRQKDLQELAAIGRSYC